MKNLVAGILGVLALSLCMAVVAQAPKKGKSRLRHVVSFKFKDSATPADVKKVEDAIAVGFDRAVGSGHFKLLSPQGLW